MWRLYDWTCQSCNTVCEDLVLQVEGVVPDTQILRCNSCQRDTSHERHKVNMPAEFLGDRPESPVVHGGQFDTAGDKALPPLPEFRGGSFKEHVSKPEYKEAKRERAVRKAENKLKKRRLQAIRAGCNVDIRHNPLPGDPKF